MDQANRCWLFSGWFWFSSRIFRARCLVHNVTLSQVFLGYFGLRLELFVRPPLLFFVICHSSEHHTHHAPRVIIHQSTKTHPTSFGTDCCSPQVLSESEARHLDLFSAQVKNAQYPPTAQSGINLYGTTTSWEGCERKLSVGTNYSSIWRDGGYPGYGGSGKSSNIELKQVPEVCS